MPFEVVDRLSSKAHEPSVELPGSTRAPGISPWYSGGWNHKIGGKSSRTRYRDIRVFN